MAAGGGLVNIGLVAGIAGALAACAATKQRPSGGADAAAGPARWRGRQAGPAAAAAVAAARSAAATPTVPGA